MKVDFGWEVDGNPGTCLVLPMVILVAGLLWMNPSASFASDRPVITLTHENDFFALQDRWYTSGLKFQWFTGAGQIPRFFNRLGQAVHVDDPESERRMVYSLGQTMFTPADITDPDPEEGTRPYAGWLFAGAGLIQDRGDRIDAYEVQMGIVGPSAMGGETQRKWHDLVGGDDPVGWDDQLRDEFGMKFTYGQKRIAWSTDVTHSTHMDFFPAWSFSLGNIQTSAQVSGGIRWGDFSEGDYGPPMIRSGIPGTGFYVPEQSFEWYIFSQLVGRYVAYEVFLDGNLLHDGPEADRIPWVGEAQLGVVLSWDSFRLNYTHVLPSKEFEVQDGTHHYGAVTLSVRW